MSEYVELDLEMTCPFCRYKTNAAYAVDAKSTKPKPDGFLAVCTHCHNVGMFCEDPSSPDKIMLRRLTETEWVRMYATNSRLIKAIEAATKDADKIREQLQRDSDKNQRSTQASDVDAYMA